MVVLTNRPAISYAETFFESTKSLPSRVKDDVFSFINRFLQDPTSRGLNYEKINTVDPSLRSVRVNGSYRAIVRIPDESAPNTYFLLWVDAHDDAYEWAKRKRITHDRTTNAVTLVETRETVEEERSSEEPQEIRFKGVFHQYENEQLKALGVEEEILFTLRAVENREQLDGIKRFFPAPVYENLVYLLEEIPFEEVYALYQEYQESAEEITLEDALTEPINRDRFFVSISEEDEELVRQFLHGEIDSWRVFLHPKQREYVEADYEGPVRIIGGPGTGKSVVAMHRAKHLLETLYTDSREKILFTTFSSNLSADLEEMMKGMLTAQGFSRLKVVNLDKIISQLLETYFPQQKLMYGDEVLFVWKGLLTENGFKGKYSENFLKTEYEEIIVEEGVESLSKYFSHSRIGRGVGLSRKEKKEIWSLVEAYQVRCEELRKWDAPSAEKKLVGYIKESFPGGLFRCVIADEVQDFRKTSLALLRAIAGEQKRNDLYLVGDQMQRIYQKREEKADEDIDSGNRVFKLLHNYRTTGEIARFAQGIVQDVPLLLEENFSPDPVISHTQGKVPSVSEFLRKEEELAYIADTVKKWTALGTLERSICILARTKNELTSIKEYLASKGIRSYEIKQSNKDDKTVSGVRLSTMHRAKGLEFDCVIIMGMNQNNMPNQKTLESAESGVEKRELMLQEKLLLYVAATRAKKELSVSCTGKMTTFIPVVNQ